MPAGMFAIPEAIDCVDEIPPIATSESPERCSYAGNHHQQSALSEVLYPVTC